MFNVRVEVVPDMHHHHLLQRLIYSLVSEYEFSSRASRLKNLIDFFTSKPLLLNFDVQAYVAQYCLYVETCAQKFSTVFLLAARNLSAESK